MINLMELFCNLVLPFVCFGDEVSDIYYLIKNEQSLKQNNLYWPSFLILIAHFLIVHASIIFLCFNDQMKEIVNNNCVLTNLGYLVPLSLRLFGPQPSMLILFLQNLLQWVFAWIWFIVTTLMLWSKLFFISNSDKFKGLAVFIFLTEIFIENIPQFFIQVINNNKSEGWETFEQVSIILSVCVVCFEFAKQGLTIYNVFKEKKNLEKDT